MTRIKQYIFSIFLIAFLINTAYGIAGMNTGNTTEQPDLVNTTESDQDIVLVQSLIEVDVVQLSSENKIFVRETLIYKNVGNKNFSGLLRTWVPDGAEIAWQGDDGRISMQNAVQRRNMMDGALEYPIQLTQKGNIISWKEQISVTGLPPLYVVAYILPGEPEGTLTTAKHYSKVLLYPTLTKQPASIVLKVIKSKEESVTVTDEKGSRISTSGNPREEENSVLYGWEMPEFKEFRIEISKPAITFAGIAGYLILGLVIILVLSYPFIRKKSEKIQALEEKIRNSLKREETEETYEEAPEETVDEVEDAIEDTTSDVMAEEGGEVPPAAEDAEFEGKTREELENLKNEMLSKLAELDKDYESGNLMDEEYEELRKPYQEKAERITKKIELPV
ncbi:MAG: hypothetical protein Q7U60_06690 [Candidatus Methanoperedens sp.]|nr:hypothetical protein [Candidatus Methanoperedens sp.]